MSTTPIPEPIIPVTPELPAAPDINTPAADLRAAAVAAEQPVPTAASVPESVAATPAPVAEPYTVTRNDDGTVSIKLETGEHFTGDPVEVASKLALAKVNTRRHYERQAEEARQSQLSSQQAPPTPQQQPAQPTPNQLPSFDQLTPEQQWLLNQDAAIHGLTGEQYLQEQRHMREQQAVRQGEAILMDFHNRCTDFPATQESYQSLLKIMQENRLPETAQGLEAAHLLAVRYGVYAPLPRPSAAPSARPTPAPMLSTQSAPQATTTDDPWKMDLAKLREQVIGQGR